MTPPDSLDRQTEAEMMRKAQERFDRLPPEEREKLQADRDMSAAEWQEKMNEGAGLSPEQIDSDITAVESEANAALEPLGETVKHDEVAALVTQEKLIDTDTNDELARTLAGKKQAETLVSGTKAQKEQILDANGLEKTAGAWNMAKNGTNKEENEFIGKHLLNGELEPIEDRSEEVLNVDTGEVADGAVISDEVLEEEKQKAEIIGDNQKLAQIEDLRKTQDKSEAEKMREQEQAVKGALDDALKHAA